MTAMARPKRSRQISSAIAVRFLSSVTSALILVFVVVSGIVSADDDANFCSVFVSSQSAKYVCQEYSVQTDDGFILKLHRLGMVNPLTGTPSPSPSPSPPGLLPPLPPAGSPALLPTLADRIDDGQASPASRFVGNHPFGTDFRLDSYPDQPFLQLSEEDQSLPEKPHSAGRNVRESVLPSANGFPTSTPVTSNAEFLDGALFERQDIHENSLMRVSATLPGQLPDETASAEFSPSASLNIVTFSPSPTPSPESITQWSPSSPPSQSPHPKPQPVLLLHQEFLSGGSWFMYTDDHGSSGDQLFPFLLADAGYDVWVGHHRATAWSHGHAFLTHTDQEYWSWSWDEHAEFDIPAMLGVVGDTTQLSVHVIGISLSATAAAAAATSTKPRVAEVMKSLTLIGPTIYSGDASPRVVEAWSYFFGRSIEQAFYDKGYARVFNFSTEFGPPTPNGRLHDPVGDALVTIAGPSCCLGSTSIPANNGWDGTTSFKNMAHIAQGVRTNTWKMFDYGVAEDNMAVYGTKSAPEYYATDLPSTLRILVVYGGHDNTAPPKGIRRFISQLAVPPATILLSEYAHLDLGFSTRRAQDVFLPIIDFLDYVESSLPR